MAEFITKCPHCNAELQAQDEWIGMEVECPECQKTFIIPKKSGGKVELAQEKKTGSSPETTASNSSFTSSDCFWFIAILIGIPLLLYWWIDWPRTVFWCTLPLWGFCLILLCGDNKGKLAMAVLAGVIWWGWWAHTQAPAATSAQANNIATEINVSVCLYNQLNEKKIPAWRGALFNYDSKLNDAWLPVVTEIGNLDTIDHFKSVNTLTEYKNIMRKLTPIKTFATREETITLDDIPSGTYLLVVVATYGKQIITWQEKIVKNNSKNMSIKLSNEKTCLILTDDQWMIYGRWL